MLQSKPQISPLFLLIDGHSLAFRSYYAFATSKKGPLHTSKGIPTSVCFGFLNSLFQVIQLQKPQFIAVAFDRRELTFRHIADANYKADRQETPEDFIPDLDNLKQLLAALNLQIITSAGYEADDVLGTLAQQASNAGYQVKIVSGDRDLFQLVDAEKNISVLYLERNGIKVTAETSYTEFDPAAVEAKLGITPAQVVDYKALCGDKSDNIPGVRGIGEKTAVKLLKEYDNLAGIYENLNQIKGATKTKLEAGKQDAEHSRYLAEIVRDVPLEIPLENCKLKGFNSQKVKPLLEKLELKTFLQQIGQLQQQLGGKAANLTEPVPALYSQQLSLFAVTTETPVTTEPSLLPRKIATVEIVPQIIDTPEKLSELVNLLEMQINQEQPVAWDTETTSLDPRHAELVGIGCCWGLAVNQIAYIPVGHLTGKQLKKQQILDTLCPILESDRYPKVLQNAKFDRAVFWHQGIQLAGVSFDTMLASYVLHPEQSHNLSDLCDRYLSGIRAISYKELGLAKDKTLANLDIETVANYCSLDAYATFQLVTPLKAELAKNPVLEKLLMEVEQPLEPVLAAMEERGIRIDVTYLQEFSAQLEKDLTAIQKSAYALAGEEFNLDSPQQLAVILFGKLGLNRQKSRKTKTGYSTDRATLEKLQGDHPLIDKILEYRTLSKLKSTYVDALPQLAEPDTHRVHTDFNQTITATGRLSSSNPNLQNIPIRSEFSRKIRKAFLPEEGWLLVSADYSQIELRILAHLSQEPVLLEAYRQGQDVHAVTAKLLFEKAEISPEERNLGKTINFGVIYGMGPQKFAKETGLSIEIGKEFIEKYRHNYARVFAYLEDRKKEAIAQGFVTTILGRRRYFDFASESLRQLRGCPPETIDLSRLKLSHIEAQLLRAAANAPIQGSSADLIKIAMLKLHQALAGYQAKLLLQVHDELVLEIPPAEWQELRIKIKSIMENAVPLSIPLVVEIHSGKNWMEAK